MRTMKILALSTLVVGFMATSAVAGDCGSKSTETANAKAKTEAQVAKAGSCGTSSAAVKTASAGGCDKSADAAMAKTAKAGACDSSAKAATKTASAGACDSKTSTAAAKTAKAGGCDSSAKAATKTASAGACDSSAKAASATKVAGAGCSSSAEATKTAKAGACDSDASSAKMAVKLETVRMPSGAMAVFYHGKNEASVAYLQKSAEGGCQAFACDLAKSVASDENCTVEMAPTETGVMMLVTAEKAEVVDGYEAQFAAVIAEDGSEQGE